MNAKMTIAIAASAALMLSACGGRGSDEAGAANGDCDPGITDTTVKLGETIPMSGAGAAYGILARTAQKYFEQVNEQGGVKFGDGKTRKVELTIMDDAYDPAKTVANTRELVEKENVFAMMGVLGTSPNEAIQEYVNQKGVPNLFMQTGADVFLDKHKDQPWAMAWLPQYGWEAEILGGQVLKEKPNAKVGILYQNDGFGKTMLKNYEKVFEGTGAKIVSAQGYEQAGGSVDAQVSKLKASGADVLLDYGTGTFMTQSLKKVADLGWKPLTMVSTGSQHVSLVAPAGPAATKDAVTFTWLKDVNDTNWADDPGMKAWHDFSSSNGIDSTDSIAANGYTVAQLMVKVMEGTKGCARQDLLDSAQSLNGATADLLLPGVSVTTNKDYPYFLSTVQMKKFDGKSWHAVGKPINHT